MIIISVVRDFVMYDNLVRHSKYNQNCEFFSFDNNQENKHISIRYNEFLDNYDYSKPEWLVFCHEDWEIQEDWQKKFDNLDKNSLYGAIGVAFNVYRMFATRTFWGAIINSNKDGTNPENIGRFAKKIKRVGTFDCQCLIVHSDLIKKYNLRFDENLSWDLYVEDFCINAKENFNINSNVLQLKCQHYSMGDLQDRYFEQLKYLKEKYKDAKNSYNNTVSYDVIGKPCKVYVLSSSSFSLKSFFYQNKITNSGKRLIKICKIPVYSRRIK